MSDVNLVSLVEEICSVHIEPNSKNILFVPQSTGLRHKELVPVQKAIKAMGINIVIIMVDSTEGIKLVSQD